MSFIDNLCQKCGDDQEKCKCNRSPKESQHGTHPQVEEDLRRYVYELTGKIEVMQDQINALTVENGNLKRAAQEREPQAVLEKLRSDIISDVKARRIFAIKEAEVTACKINRKTQLDKVAAHEKTLNDLGATFEQWSYSWELAKCPN